VIPLLPANPNTITPVQLSLDDRLEFLRRLDTYERTTSPERELEKVQLEQQLKTKENK
jgi:hypothetical protein